MSYNLILKNRYKNIFHNSGKAFFFQSFLLLILSLLSFFIYKDIKTGVSFLLTYLICLGISFLFRFLGRGKKLDIFNVQDAVMMIFFVWTISIFISALPFVFGNILKIHHAIFEATSGWTTTGLSLITDVEIIPKPYLLWRSLIQYFGGAGFALIMLVTAGSMGVGIYQAEGRSDNLVPNFKDSVKIIGIIYFSWTILGILALLLIGKMNFFDSFNHTLTALATGGFSTKNDSIAAFNSVKVETIIIILMIAGSTGFGVHYAFTQMFKNTSSNIKEYFSKKIDKFEFRDRVKREPFFKNPEPKTMAVIIFIFLIIVFFFSARYLYETNEAIRHTIFQVVSGLTGTGFSSTDLIPWNTIGLLSIVILMIIGGMMDSTSGGLKLFRVYIIIRVIKSRISLFFKPKGTTFHIEVRKGMSKKLIDNESLREVISIVFIYFLVYFIGVFVMLAYGYNLEESLFEYASALSAVGLSVGTTTPEAPNGIIWVKTIGMYLGRLEFFAIFYAIIKLYKDLKQGLLTKLNKK